MIRQTYGDLLPELSLTAGVTGMSVTDPRMLARTNKAVQELMAEGPWPGVVDRWHIRAVNGSICLPPELDMLLEFTADGVPSQIKSPWAEFVNYGPGPAYDLLPRGGRRNWFCCGTSNLYDRGESCTQTPIPVSDGSCSCDDIPVGPWVLRQYANPATDETPDIYATIQGLDPDGLVVRSLNSSTWNNGIRLGITSGSGFTESTQEFSVVEAYTKPATNGYVRLTAWNGTVEVELANYAPWEKTPSYHHYFSPYLQAAVNSGPCCRVVLARARRRFVPVVELTDVMLISNVLALEAMMIAQQKRTAGNYEAYAAMKLTAVDIMRKESSVYTGKVRAPSLTFQRGFSLGELPAIR